MSSTNVASRSATPASWISSTFSALRSPERERLKEPTKTTSSATTNLACMKSWSDSGVHGVDGLPENGAAGGPCSSSGIFQALTPFVAHWWKTSSTWVSSTTPATSQRCSFATSASVREDRAGGEHGRCDPDPPPRAAEELRDAVRECVAVLGREPGRTSMPSLDRTGRGWTRPVCSTCRARQSSSKLSVNARASAGEPRRARSRSPGGSTSRWSSSSSPTTRRCRRGRRTCGASGRGRPAIARVGTGSASIASGLVSGGGGTGIGPGWSTL